MNNQAAYDAMVEEAIKKSLPKLYLADLIHHDRKWLGKSADGIRFGWILRECGTNLTPSGSSLDDLQSMNALYRDHAHFYFWDGEKLEEMTIEVLARRLQEAESD